MSLYHSISRFSKKGASMVPSSRQYDDFADEFGYDTVDDYALPLHRTGKGSRTHAGEALHTRTGAPKEELPIPLDDEYDDEMIMNLLGEQLEEEMLAIEGHRMYHQETSVRIIVLGAATEKAKRVCIQKMSQALQIRCHRTHLSVSNNFKERKHHIVRGALDIIERPSEDGVLCVQTFDDIGLSIIEADFSWSTGHAKKIMHYASLLLEHCKEEPALSLQDTEGEEGGIVFYPRSAQGNTINICIYFYESSQYLAAVEEDLDHLQQLQGMGVSILPILVSNMIENTDISALRAQLSNLLERYQILPKTLSTLLVDTGPSPSFVKRSSRCYQVSNDQTMNEIRWNSECIDSKHIRSAPCFDILTIHQFAALNGHFISKHILEGCTTSARNQGHMNKEDVTSRRSYSSSNLIAHADAAATAAVQSRRLMTCLLMFILGTFLTIGFVTWCWNRPASWDEQLTLEAPLSTHISLGRFTEDGRLFIQVDVCGGNGDICERHHIPIPMCAQPGTLPLGTIHINARNSRIDLIKQDPALMCSTPTRTSSNHSAHPPTKAYHQKEKKCRYWLRLRKTAIFLFEHHSRILRSIFAKTLD